MAQPGGGFRDLALRHQMGTDGMPELMQHRIRQPSRVPQPLELVS